MPFYRNEEERVKFIGASVGVPQEIVKIFTNQIGETAYKRTSDGAILPVSGNAIIISCLRYVYNRHHHLINSLDDLQRLIAEYNKYYPFSTEDFVKRTVMKDGQSLSFKENRTFKNMVVDDIFGEQLSLPFLSDMPEKEVDLLYEWLF